MRQRPGRADGDLVPISRPLLDLFRTYLRWYLPRHFTAMRVAHAGRWQSIPDPGSPLIVCVNHASWWDPLTGLLLSQFLLPGRDLYVPMDEAALEHYGLFKRLGVFPVEQGTHRGAEQFLRSSMQVLSDKRRVLWITPQGAFTDVRARPVTLQSGLAALAKRVPGITICPMAFEYTFWNERMPEILINDGEPLVVPPDGTVPDLQAAMTRTLEELALIGIARDADVFQTVLAGHSGVGGIYGLWQRLRDVLRGRRDKPSHGSIRR